jgi:hypothetical protein
MEHILPYLDIRIQIVGYRGKIRKKKKSLAGIFFSVTVGSERIKATESWKLHSQSIL